MKYFLPFTFTRVWNFNDEAGFSQVVQLSLPRWAVPGSASGELLVAGGLALPSASRAGLRAGLVTEPGLAAAIDPPTSLAAAAAALAPLLTLEQSNLTEHEEMMNQLPGLVRSYYHSKIHSKCTDYVLYLRNFFFLESVVL